MIKIACGDCSPKQAFARAEFYDAITLMRYEGRSEPTTMAYDDRERGQI